MTFFAQRSPADLVQRLQSNDTVAETLARDLAAAGVDAVVVVLYAVLLWTYDPQLTVRRHRWSRCSTWWRCGSWSGCAPPVRRSCGRTRARLTNTAYSGLQLIETMKATGGEDGYFRRWAGQHATTLDEQQRLGVPSAGWAWSRPRWPR